jgi:DNA-binding MarR family transcriptional regulator
MQELAYYREHFLEVFREDGVVCLECGALFKAVGSHVFYAHHINADDYREKWGYNRQTTFLVESSHERRRQIALARDLGALLDPGRIEKARAVRGSTLPRRRETRLTMSKTVKAKYARGWQPFRHRKVDDGTLRAFAEEGYTARELAEKTGLSRQQVRRRLRALGLIPPQVPRNRTTNQEILKLSTSGLWPSEIAARTGLASDTVARRLRNLRRAGVPVPTPKRPRPNSRRRLADEKFLPLVRKGLKPAEIAARLGVEKKYVIRKAQYLRSRGLLERTWVWKKRRR